MITVEGSLSKPGFLADGSEMGECIRVHDWSQTPLGPAEAWPPALRIALATVLASPIPSVLVWGPGLITLHNDAYRPLLGGRPDALGRPFPDIWPHARHAIVPLIDRALAGKASRLAGAQFTLLRGGVPGDTYFDYAFSPVRDETGAVVGVLNTAVETTGRLLAERAQAFRLELEERLRDVVAPREVMAVAVELLGRHLGANRVGYGEVQADDVTVVLHSCFANGVAPLDGSYRLDSFGPEQIARQRGGLTQWSNDLTLDPGQDQGVWAAIETRAYASVPLVRAGRFAASLYVNFRQPHAWTSDELALINEVANRTWVAVERARAEAALRESEEFNRRVLQSSADCIKVLGLDGRLERMSDGGQRALGITDLSVRLGRPWADGFEPDWRAVAHAAVREAASGRTGRFEGSLSTEGGEVRWWDSVLTPILAADGRPERVLVVSRDITDLRAAQDRLRESEARFRNMADHAPVMMWVTDPSGSCTYLNARWYEFTGQRPGAGEAYGWLDAVHPEDRPAAEDAFVAANAERRNYQIDFRLRRADGAYRWVIDAAATRFAQDTEYLGYVGSVIDIDDRREAEQRIQDNEERLRLATEAAEVGFWDVDVVGGLLIWPPRVKAMFGISPEVPVTLADFYGGLHPDDRDATTAAFAAACDPEQRALYDVEYRTVGKEDGVVRWVAAKGRGRFTAEGVCVRVLGTAIDITARKADEVRLRELNETLERRVNERTAELSESQRRFQGIFDSALQFMALLTPDGAVVEVNQTALAWSQIEPADIVGKPFWLAAPMRENPALQDAIAAGIRRAAAGETVREEHEMRGAGEVRATVDFSLKPVPGERNEPIWLVAEGRDITELKQAQEALRQSQKMEAMGQLTGGVAHDFNNLLTPIIGSLDMLTRRGVGNERERRLIDGALQSAERAKTLVQRLLAFARRQPLQASAVDLSHLIEGMAGLIGSTLGPNIDIRVELADALPPARADANQLEMALLNLAVNARDAMRDGGTLTIRAVRESVREGHRSKLRRGHYVRLSVSDTGIGMDADTLSRAVEPFFSTKGIGKGTGLGLSMVHGLAAQLGGGMSIASEPGRGTQVDLWLPISVVPLGAADGDLVAPAPVKTRGRALLVDDEELVRMSTADMLMDLGYDVVEAGSAEDALRLLQEGPTVDLLVTDHLMPGMNGADLARAARVLRPDLPVLIVSGYAEVDGIAPDLPRLTKPFRNAELAERIAGLSERAAD